MATPMPQHPLLEAARRQSANSRRLLQSLQRRQLQRKLHPQQLQNRQCRDKKSHTKCPTRHHRHHPCAHSQPQLQTVNPRLLVYRYPRLSSRQSVPPVSWQVVGSTPNGKKRSAASPYTDRGHGDVWMGSQGYQVWFARQQLGTGKKIEKLQTYKPEPLEPLFGLEEHLEPLPPPEPEVEPELGVDMDWMKYVPSESRAPIAGVLGIQGSDASWTMMSGMNGTDEYCKAERMVWVQGNNGKFRPVGTGNARMTWT
ncbi:hypothetical protein BKA56DRAFT_618830 [Ilyonectria sp. MPI-CAGE-AT-0026]|nr:hypothetical protein BKA56DRAFT_618830 [Ilyonectria sp. MPI-CAGE-AT-0026]